MPETFLAAAKAATNGQVDGRIPAVADRGRRRCRITTSAPRTRNCAICARRSAKIAADHGLAILAAGTHPTADWGRSQQSEGERYDAVMDDLQMIGQRNMLCGLHVHVELPDPDDRVDVMTRMLPYLPLFIALATSSPFWRSRPTGLKGYRLAAYDELPRTGVPELFRTKEEFDAYVDGAGEGRRDAGFELRLVVDAALAQASDAGAARARLPDAGRRFDRDRRAVALAGAAAHPQSAAQPRPQRGDARDRGREQVARAALRRARHASSATTARSRSPT